MAELDDERPSASRRVWAALRSENPRAKYTGIGIAGLLLVAFGLVLAVRGDEGTSPRTFITMGATYVVIAGGVLVFRRPTRH